ncbi:hypothetical protein HY357_01545 [Candidatus Roizmanbacteria bacterium]|nr:hypothetical protein [Candidatus Roizmanbacteria bacterium]
MIISVLFLILILSFILALRSMKDFEIPSEIQKLLKFKEIKGTILFFKDKTKHYRA